jgi:hypothetical protein
VAGGEPLTVAGAVEGTAQDLLTTLWKRTPISVLALSGDEAVVTRLLASRLTA